MQCTRNVKLYLSCYNRCLQSRASQIIVLGLRSCYNQDVMNTTELLNMAMGGAKCYDIVSKDSKSLIFNNVLLKFC